MSGRIDLLSEKISTKRAFANFYARVAFLAPEPQAPLARNERRHLPLKSSTGSACCGAAPVSGPRLLQGLNFFVLFGVNFRSDHVYFFCEA